MFFLSTHANYCEQMTENTEWRRTIKFKIIH